MSYDLLLNNPGLFTIYSFISFIITISAYCAFPLLYARFRKKVIGKKEYFISCYLFNFLIKLLFWGINGNFSSVSAYLLWTWVFSALGIKSLRHRGVLQGSLPLDFTPASSPQSSENDTIGASEITKVPEESAPSTESEPIVNSASELIPVPSTETLEDFPVPQTPEQAALAVEAPVAVPDTVLPIDSNKGTTNDEICMSAQQNSVQAPQPHVHKAKGSAVGVTLLFILLSTLLMVSIGLNVFQYIKNKESINSANDQIAVLKNTLSGKDDIISSQSELISSLRYEMLSFAKDSTRLNAIYDELRSGNYGYASKNFRASESVIVVSKNEKNRKFLLTANGSGRGSVSCDYSVLSKYIATVSFDNDSWSKDTSVTVHPWGEGVSVVTFRNSKNDESFKVMIIVI